jgi:hypothetical protein
VSVKVQFIASTRTARLMCLQSRSAGPMNIARTVAREWQTDGYLKPGNSLTCEG